jgi:hypothetical protein
VSAPFLTVTKIEGGVVASRQWLDVPIALDDRQRDELLARLDPLYFDWINAVMGWLTEAEIAPDGSAFAKIRPFGVPTGLALGAPRRSPGRSARSIDGGWLVGAAEGELALEVAPVAGGTRLAVDLWGFRPRLLSVPWIGPWFYRGWQLALHVRVSRAILREAARMALDAGRARCAAVAVEEERPCPTRSPTRSS